MFNNVLIKRVPNAVALVYFAAAMLAILVATVIH
jgi:hypothetical protein